MTPTVVLSAIAIVGIVFLLRFLVALFHEIKSRARDAVQELPKPVDKHDVLVAGFTQDFEPPIRSDVPMTARKRPQGMAVGQD